MRRVLKGLRMTVGTGKPSGKNIRGEKLKKHQKAGEPPASETTVSLLQYGPVGVTQRKGGL